ncbi:MAG TPA: hypothetical protein VG125_11085 [Pirellulales bacterium]|jgi:hypothetical protein|nr:hypothetical protein [Pirellulales bacterium]
MDQPRKQPGTNRTEQTATTTADSATVIEHSEQVPAIAATIVVALKMALKLN